MDGRLNGLVWDLPTGKLSYAVGGGFLDENLQISSDGLLQTGNAIGYNPNPTFAGGTRTRDYAFAEMVIPILGPDQNVPGFHSLIVNPSGRYERLEPGGESKVPRVALTWQPIDEQVTFRASYSEGFVAPPLFDLFGPITPNNPTVNVVNPVLGNGSGQITSGEGPNPVLPPANSVNWNAGVTLKPKFIPGPGVLTLTADYYNITETGIPALPDYNQVVASLNAQGSASPYASGFTFADNSHLTTTAPNQVAFSSGDPAHDIGVVNVHYQPGAAQRTDGIDLGMNYAWPTENWGTFTLAGNANVLNGFEAKLNPSAKYYEYGGQYTSPTSIALPQGTLPDWFVTDSFTWDILGFTFNAASRFVPNITDLGDMFPTSGATSNSHTYNGKPWTVDSWFSVDLQLSYRFGDKYGRWLHGTRLTVGCNNVSDNLPPFVSSGSEDNTDKQMYDIVGRFIYFEVAKKF
jgi:hypothetical protein